MLEWVVDNPFAPIVSVSAATAAAFALVIAIGRVGALGALASPAVFLAAYYATYQKIPSFPPTGAANKVLYVGLVAAVGAIVLDLIPPFPAWLKAALAALLGVLWVGATQWPRADFAFVAMSGAIVLGGGFALWLTLLQNATAGAAAAMAMSAALAALLAPVALFGGSSTGVGLCLGVAAGLALLSAAYLKTPLKLPNAALLPAGAGLLALVDAVALVSRQADFLALALAAAAPLLGHYAIRLVPAGARFTPLGVWLVSGLATLSPLVAMFALLFWRHESPL